MQRAIEAENRDSAFTVCLLGDPIGCGGVTMYGEKGEMWGLFSPLIKAMPVALFRATRDCLNRIIEERKPKELFSCADLKNEKSQRFLRHLGFKKLDTPPAALVVENERMNYELYVRKLEGR